MHIQFINPTADFVIMIIKGLSFLERRKTGVPCECFKLKNPPPPAKTTMWGWGRGEEKTERKETLSRAVSLGNLPASQNTLVVLQQKTA